jgi:glutamine amidotransferase
MPADVAVIDYGSGNVRSLVNALQRVVPSGKTVLLTSEPSRILDAERAILPGVGAFGAVMQKLERAGWIPFLDGFRASGRPLLGICVGMQVFGKEGDEFGIHPGLDWVRGRARCLNSGPGLKLPHIGWSPLDGHGDSELFDGLGASPFFYFVHSFVLDCEDPGDVIGWAEYGERFAAAVRNANVIGTQFHPEKSDRAGLRFLANFCRWIPR